MSQSKPEAECCPKFDPSPWQEKSFTWKNKLFIKDKVITAFHIPLNFGAVIKRNMAKIESAGAKSIDWMGLSDHTSKWSMDIYLAVDKEVTGAENVTLSGEYLSKAYEGNFNKTGEWCKDFNEFVKSKGKTLTKMYMWYTTCPKCAKKYGKNYTVIIGQVS